MFGTPSTTAREFSSEPNGKDQYSVDSTDEGTV